MEFENEFEVAAPIDEVWRTLLDVERVAPCMPGAQVLEKTGERSYRVAVKVKLGPVSMQYRGDVEIADVDDSAHTATMTARATEARGQGTANATIGMRLDERGPATHAVLQTDLRLSGRAAAMGGGMVKDVSAKMVETFAGNLQEMLAGAPAEAAAAPAAGERSATAAAAPEPRPSARAAGEPSATGEPSAAGAPPPASDEALPAAQIAASIAADRLRDPRVLGGTLIVVWLLGWLMGRRRP
jgi:uncharacterized protein